MQIVDDVPRGLQDPGPAQLLDERLELWPSCVDVVIDLGLGAGGLFKELLVEPSGSVTSQQKGWVLIEHVFDLGALARGRRRDGIDLEEWRGRQARAHR